jgi:hypothetical protein
MRSLRRTLPLLILVLTSCDSSNSIRGIRIARYSETESRRALQEFLIAAARNDTVRLRSLTTDDVLRRVTRDHSDGRFLHEYKGAAASNGTTDVEVVLGGADLEFGYEVDRKPRRGRASLRYQDGGWRVTHFALMVEH